MLSVKDVQPFIWCINGQARTCDTHLMSRAPAHIDIATSLPASGVAQLHRNIGDV